MKKVLILLFLASSYVAASQSREVKKMSFEFGSGYSFAAAKNTDTEVKGLFGGYFEVRYNLEHMPVDLGLHLGITGTERTALYYLIPDMPGYITENFLSFSTLTVGDYVFNRGRKVSPFVGMGVGVSFSNTTAIFNEGYVVTGTFMPRIGVRFLNHITLSLDYQVIHKDYSHANVRFGFYF